MITRIMLTVVILFFSGWISGIVNPVAMIGAGQVAGLQMQSSDPAAVASFVGMRFFSSLGSWVVGVAFLLLLVVWWAPLRRGWAVVVAEWNDALKVLPLAGAISLALVGPADAFWNQTNTTEAYGIMPNHTAFWVPGTGDTKANQAQMETEDFYKANKVAGKFFVIPHVKLSGSTYMGWDYFIPAGRLIVVDRAPYFHEWAKKGRGTDANSDQSFPCHTKDNIPASAEISLASSVTEENAAKFLYYFGVNPPAGNPATPEVIFTSVFESRSLGQVMSTWGRGEVQSRVCRHILEHTVEDLAQNGNEVLNAIQEETRKFFETFGITIEYVGWAGGFAYPAEVQDAINTRFAAEHIKPVLETLQTKAVVDAISGWDRKLPASLTILGSGPIADVVAGFKAAQPAAQPAAKP